jgi:hypothetical protein
VAYLQSISYHSSADIGLARSKEMRMRECMSGYAEVCCTRRKSIELLLQRQWERKLLCFEKVVETCAIEYTGIASWAVAVANHLEVQLALRV